MPSPLKHLLACLAVLAVGATQVLGISRGYFCDCSGEPVAVESALCLSEVCHPGHDHGPENLRGQHHDDHDDHHDGEDHQESPHEHGKLAEASLGAVFIPLSVVLPVLTESPLPGLPVEPGISQVSIEQEHRAELKPPERTGAIPSYALLVSETVVMLV